MLRISSALAVAAATLVCGCSFAATSGPGPNYKPSRQPDCSTSGASPVIDTVVGIAGAALAVSMFSQDCDDDDSGLCRALTNTFGTMGVLTAALWGTGALVGARHNRSCRAARAKHIAYIDGLDHDGPDASDDPWTQPGDWGAAAPRRRLKSKPTAPTGDAIHSNLCKRWRARVFAAPVGDARLAVIRQMPSECHE